MIQIEKLKEFCEAHEHLLMYGAGQFAWTVFPFLGTRGIVPEAVLVSGQPAAPTFSASVPEYRAADFPKEPGERYGIVLALQEIFHADVQVRIREIFGEAADVFVLRDRDVEHAIALYSTERMFELLEAEEAISPEEAAAFEVRMQEILQRHTCVRIRFIDMRSIGCLLAWVYWCEQRRKQEGDGLYWLLWPVAQPLRKELELKGANAYISGKLSMPGMEVVTKQRLKFWRYFYQQDTASFLFDTNYALADWIRQMDTYFWRHNEAIDGTYLSFTEAEEQHGRELAERMGINGAFVCFSTRDNLYVSKVMKYQTDVAGRSIRYRAYPLEHLRPAMESLAQHGLQAVRMGAMVGERIDWSNTIDYAHDGRSEFMDAWLFAHCQFFACDPSGIQAISWLFSKPNAMFNLTIQTTRNDYGTMTTPERDLGIFKKYWLPSEQRYLTLREMIRAEQREDVHTFASVSAYTTYDRMGVIPVENTPEEVTELVTEMARRLDGTMEYTAEDERLQARYREIVDTTPMKHNFPWIFRAGAHFLRTNPWFLE